MSTRSHAWTVMTDSLPDPPPGFRWELGGWMGPTPARPWPDLKPDPDVMIAFPVSAWREIRGHLNTYGRGQSVMVGSVAGVNAQQHADRIWRAVGLDVAAHADTDPSCR